MAVLLTAVTVFYVSLKETLRRDHDEFLSAKILVLRQLLSDRADDTMALQEEVEQNWAPRQYVQVEARLLRDDGTIVAESPGMSERLPPRMFPPPSPGDLSTTDGIDLRGQGGRPFRAMSGDAVFHSRSRPPAHAVIQLALDTLPEQNLLAAYRARLMLISAAATAVLILAAYQVARRGLRPLYEIARTAQGVGPSRLDARIRLAGLPGELADLAETLNRMLERLDEAFGRLSRFSSDIAHELRTPVTNLRMSVEVCLGQNRESAEYREALVSALEESGRLSRIIDSMLFIARADNPHTTIEREVLNVAQEIAVVCEFFEAPASEASIQLQVRCAEPLTACLDRTLFQRALANLVSNSLDYTPAGGKVTVSAAQAGAELQVKVSDTGVGIQAKDLPHLFERFYRADTARSNRAGHCGLGLAIVKSITSLHGGTVDIQSTPNAGTTVCLRFPLASEESARKPVAGLAAVPFLVD